MDFTLDTFYADFFKARDFRAHIYTPSLVKTRLDLVYTDIVNWERSGLLDIMMYLFLPFGIELVA